MTRISSIEAHLLSAGGSTAFVVYYSLEQNGTYIETISQYDFIGIIVQLSQE